MRYTPHSYYSEVRIFSVHSALLRMREASRKVDHIQAFLALLPLFQAFSQKSTFVVRFSARFHEHRSQGRKVG